MSDKQQQQQQQQQDPGDEIRTISHKFRSVTTLEPIFNATPTERSKFVNVNYDEATTTAVVAPRTPSESSTRINDGSSEKSHRLVRRNLPEINLPEKILLVVDTAREAEYTPFKLGNGTKYSPLFMIRRVIENFVCAKSGIRQGHEFALMTIGADGARWMCDFTANTKAIVDQMETIVEEILERKEDALESEDSRERTYDLGQLFRKIETRLPLPTTTGRNSDDDGHDDRLALPNFVTRVILIYTRSDSIPRFHTGQREYLERLTENPYFFLDALFVHEPACGEHACERVYAGITALDTTSLSYILEVGRNAAKLHDNMAKLLAHPLQRPPQRDAQYAIFRPTGLQEPVRANVC